MDDWRFTPVEFCASCAGPFIAGVTLAFGIALAGTFGNDSVLRVGTMSRNGFHA